MFSGFKIISNLTKLCLRERKRKLNIFFQRNHSLNNTKGNPPNPECIYKKLCIYSYMFKLQSPLKYSWCSTPYWDVISTVQKQFCNSLILMPFSASAIFCFTTSTLTICFPLRTFFIQGNKKVTLGEVWWIGRVGHGDHAIFW